LITGLVIVHLAAVHQDGSNNPLGISSKTDKISFFPYFFIKDTLSFIFFLLFFSYFVFYAPNTLGHTDNFIERNHYQKSRTTQWTKYAQTLTFNLRVFLRTTARAVLLILYVNVQKIVMIPVICRTLPMKD
jgi:quinol-cytochrome oxidoreductase complex cytochrome b subunit